MRRYCFLIRLILSNLLIITTLSIADVSAQDGGLGPYEVNTITYSPDGAIIAVGGGPFGCLPPGTPDTSPFEIRLLDSQSGQLIDTFGDHLCTVNSLAWSPDGTLLASSGDDGLSSVWTVSTRQLLSRAEGIFQVPVSGSSWSADGQLVADFNPQTSGVRIWSASTGTTLSFLEDPGDLNRVRSLSWSPDGSYLAVGNDGSNVQIWDVSSIGSTGTGQLIASFSNSPANSLAWKPDGTQLAIGGVDILILDATTGSTLHVLTGHANAVLSVAWNTAGTLLASGSLDNTVRIWDTVTGQQLETIQTTGVVRAVDWSPNGTQIAYGGAGGTVDIVPAPGVATPTPTLTDTPTHTPTFTPSLPAVNPLSVCWVKHWNGTGSTEWRITNPNSDLWSACRIPEYATTGLSMISRTRKGISFNQRRTWTTATRIL